MSSTILRWLILITKFWWQSVNGAGEEDVSVFIFNFLSLCLKNVIFSNANKRKKGKINQTVGGCGDLMKSQGTRVSGRNAEPSNISFEQKEFPLWKKSSKYPPLYPRFLFHETLEKKRKKTFLNFHLSSIFLLFCVIFHFEARAK